MENGDITVPKFWINQSEAPYAVLMFFYDIKSLRWYAHIRTVSLKRTVCVYHGWIFQKTKCYEITAKLKTGKYLTCRSEWFEWNLRRKPKANFRAKNAAAALRASRFLLFFVLLGTVFDGLVTKCLWKENYFYWIKQLKKEFILPLFQNESGCKSLHMKIVLFTYSFPWKSWFAPGPALKQLRKGNLKQTHLKLLFFLP